MLKAHLRQLQIAFKFGYFRCKFLKLRMLRGLAVNPHNDVGIESRKSEPAFFSCK